MNNRVYKEETFKKAYQHMISKTRANLRKAKIGKILYGNPYDVLLTGTILKSGHFLV